MSNHDTTPIELEDGDLQAACAATEESPDAALADDGAPDFKISVRKIQVKVQARGVLAE